MSKRKKWKYKGVNDSTSFSEAGSIILKHRCNAVKISIKRFLEDYSEENLHEIRITLRRLRYNMEVFSSCFEKKKYLIFYNIIENLQDLTGRKRDLDVLLINIKKLSADTDVNIDIKFFKAIEKERDMLNDTLTLQFFKYLHGKELKDFMKLLKKDGDKR